MIEEPDNRRILVIKLADLGDVLICEPAFRSLRTAFPDAHIHVLTTPAATALLELFGHDLLPFSFPKSLFDHPASLSNPRLILKALRLALRLRSSRYDRVVVLHHLTTSFGAKKFAALAAATGSKMVVGLDNGRGTFLSHRVDDLGFGQRHEATYMRDVAVAAGGAMVDDAPMISAAFLSESPFDVPASRYAVLYPATGPFSRAREWPTERFAALAHWLKQQDFTPVVVGTEDASPLARQIRVAEPSTIDMTGRTSLNELAAVVSGASVVIGGDSFVGHLAAAVSTPVVSIFGPSNADAWRPFGSKNFSVQESSAGRSLVVRHDMPCQPCIYTGFRLGRPHGCQDRTCLKNVGVRDVEQAVARVLGGT